MNIEYISGFFDADGYVTFSKNKRNTIMPTPIVGFTTNDLRLLLHIRFFLKTTYHLTGAICEKKPRKDTHHTSYDLKYTYQQALVLLEHMQVRQAIKQHRKMVLLNHYNGLVRRNGKYKKDELLAINELINMFYQ